MQINLSQKEKRKMFANTLQTENREKNYQTFESKRLGKTVFNPTEKRKLGKSFSNSHAYLCYTQMKNTETT